MLRFRDFIAESTYKAHSGESEILHHLTPHKFDQFKPMSHFGTAQASRSLMKFRMDDDNVKGKAIIHHAVRLKLGNVRHMEADQTNSGHRPDVVNDMLYQNKIISRKQYETNKKKGRSLTNYDLARTLKSNNIQTIAYKNEFEDPGSTSYIITDPKQVRRLQLNLNTKINFNRYKEFSDFD
jgi:hypothetical protein